MNNMSDQGSHFSFVPTEAAQNRKSRWTAFAAWGSVIACACALGFFGWRHGDRSLGRAPQKAAVVPTPRADVHASVRQRSRAQVETVPAPSPTREDAALRRQVERDIATHPGLRRLGLAVEIVKVENGYVTLGLANGPAGLALELTGEKWERVAIPGFPTARRQAGFTTGRPGQANSITCAGTAPEEREACACACRNLAAAADRNPMCKGVFWEEVPTARARRLFVEAGTVFCGGDTPLWGKPLLQAYYDYVERRSKTEGFSIYGFPPAITRFFAEKLDEASGDLFVAFRPYWGTPEHAQGWVCLFLLDDEELLPSWFAAYREAWKTPDFWKQVRKSDADAPDAVEMIAVWEKIETLMRTGRLDLLLSEVDQLDLPLDDENAGEPLGGPFSDDLTFSIALPFVSLVFALEANKAELATVWKSAKATADLQAAERRAVNVEKR